MLGADTFRPKQQTDPSNRYNCNKKQKKNIKKLNKDYIKTQQRLHKMSKGFHKS